MPRAADAAAQLGKLGATTAMTIPVRDMSVVENVFVIRISTAILERLAAKRGITTTTELNGYVGGHV